jgi:hypothetical protein
VCSIQYTIREVKQEVLEEEGRSRTIRRPSKMGRPHCVKNCVKNEKLLLVFAIFSW